MRKMWKKPYRLQSIIRNMTKPMKGIKDQVVYVRGKLNEAQQNLLQDRMNPNLIEEVKYYVEHMFHLNNLEE